MIVFDNVDKLDGQTFRVAEMSGRVCNRALWCRLDRKNDDFRLTFYDSLRGAEADWNPLTSLTRELMPLALEAINRAQRLMDQWELE